MQTGWLICCVLLGSDPGPIQIDAALLTVADQAEVAARDAGLLVEMLAREGMMVKAGEPLAQLDDSEAKLNVARALIDLERAKKLASNDIKVRLAQVEVEFAASELLRAQEAEKKLSKSVSAAEFDRLSSNGKRAALDLEQAQFDFEAAKLAAATFESEYQLAQDKLHRRRVVAPISGVVVQVPKRRGEWVELGQPVARILSLDKFRVEFFLDSTRATSELIGKTVRFALPTSVRESGVYTGRVAVVSPEVDPLNGQVRIWAEIDNKDGRLRPGLAGSLVIQP